jgi:hypothetical protein
METPTRGSACSLAPLHFRFLKRQTQDPSDPGPQDRDYRPQKLIKELGCMAHALRCIDPSKSPAH